MKKYISFFSILFLSHLALADVKPSVQEILDYAERGETIPVTTIERASREQNHVQISIDMVLHQLLSLPYEQRQYVFPGLFDTPAVPKKIRTHPEIAIWEGKKPTNIAPELQAFAEQYLDDLNPKLYLYLSPAYYQSSKKDAPETTDLAITTRNISTPKQIPDNNFKGYPDIYQTITQPDELIQNPNMAVLSEKDIARVANGLKTLTQFLNHELSSNPSFRSGYQMLSTFYSDADSERINPFQAKVERLRLMKRVQDLDKLLQQVGFKDSNEFALITDTMARAYRAARMPLRMAFEARRYRAQEPTDPIKRATLTAAKMYESLPKDVYFVDTHLEEVRQAFIETGYQNVLNAETVDSVRN
jgi:hypothetical protein